MMFVEFWTVVSKGFKQLFYWTGNHCCKCIPYKRRDKRKCLPATTMRRHHDHDCFIAHNPHCPFLLSASSSIHRPCFHLSYLLGQAHAEYTQLVACGPFLRFVVYTWPTFLSFCFSLANPPVPASIFSSRFPNACCLHASSPRLPVLRLIAAR